MTTWSSLVTANWGECAEDHQCDKKPTVFSEVSSVVGNPVHNTYLI